MIQPALRARLLANSTVAAMAGTRVDWDWRQQGKGLPAVTLQIVSDPRPQHMDGNQVTRMTLVRAHCWAETASGAANLAEAVIATLVPAADQGAVRFLRSFATLRGSDEETTPTGIVHRQIVDLEVWHTPIP
jgi:hypothetical protein